MSKLRQGGGGGRHACVGMCVVLPEHFSFSASKTKFLLTLKQGTKKLIVWVYVADYRYQESYVSLGMSNQKLEKGRKTLEE